MVFTVWSIPSTICLKHSLTNGSVLLILGSLVIGFLASDQQARGIEPFTTDIVPAAMRLAAPKANPSLYLPMALAITFPFNITLGMPLYLWVVQSF